jgi:F-type H+-transporting ATPase subunit epsilon
MADGIRIEIVSPERLLLSTQAVSVTVPGSEGYFTILGEHAPVMTTLKPGFITALINGNAEIFYVRSGFAEVNANGVTILAEEALPLGEIERPRIEEALNEARATLEVADDEHKSDAELIVMSLENFINEMTTFEPGNGAHQGGAH